MRKLIKYLRPFKKQCIIGPLCKLIEAILEIMLPTIMAFLINDGVTKQNTSLVWTLSIVMIVMVFIGFGFSMTCQYEAALASQGFGTNIRNHMMKHIASFAYQDIDHFGTSSLSNRLGNDINQLQLAVAMLIRLVIRSPFIIVGAIIMSMLLDMKLSLILIATVPFIIIILYIFIRLTSPMYQLYQKKLDQFATLVNDHLSGIRVIRAFVSQRQEKQKFDEQSNDLQKQMLRVSRCSALLNPLCALVVNGAIVILLWTGLLQIQTNQIEPGTIIAFINYATQILIALIATSNLIVIFTKASASAKRVNEVLDYLPTMKEGSIASIQETSTAITFDQVTFAYEGSDAVLHDLSFSINKAESIGIIGGTGSGKSTLAHLLTRFYDTTNGTIHLFQTPIRDLTFSTLHDCVTIVSQKNELFSQTIQQNITMGKSYPQERIEQVLRDAQCMDFIKALPQGIDTMVERGGANLSGGQKQRLCIARGLLTQTPILILDDSCSALDFKTDAALRSALKNYPCTLLMISQRVGTLLTCDRIMVLDKGKLVGFDTHEALHEHCAIYREICETQAVGRDVS